MKSKQSEINLTDDHVFSIMFSKYQTQIFRYLFGLSGGPREEVEDLTSETFSRAWSSRNHFSGNSDAVRNWLFTIAKNQLIDKHRK